MYDLSITLLFLQQLRQIQKQNILGPTLEYPATYLHISQWFEEL